MIGSSAPDFRMPKLTAIGAFTTFVTTDARYGGIALLRLNASTSGVTAAIVVEPTAKVLRHRVR